MIARARALQEVSRRRPVFANLTAVAIHGKPVTRADTTKVHVIDQGARSGAVAGVVQHRGVVLDDEIVEIDGLRCTSLVRTLADVARTASAETSVSVADAALRSVAFRSQSDYLVDAAEDLRSAALAVATRSAHGSARARRVLEFADGHAQLPGESISRLDLARMRFARPRLQVAVRSPSGGWYYVDFELEDVDAFGEFDGDGKYSDPALLGGLTPAQAVAREKEREDWIRGVTNRRVVRWGSKDIRSVDALRARLRAFGIVPPQ